MHRGIIHVCSWCSQVSLPLRLGEGKRHAYAGEWFVCAGAEHGHFWAYKEHVKAEGYAGGDKSKTNVLPQCSSERIVEQGVDVMVHQI